MFEALLTVLTKQKPPKGWTKLANMPIAINGHASSGVGNVLYIAGGYGTGSNYRADFISYNVDTQQYATLAPMPKGRLYFEMGAIGNKIYVYGGLTTGGVLVDTLDCYDIALGTWSTLNPPTSPAPRREYRSAVYNSKLYVAGGSTAATTGVKETWCYDPVANTWTQLADMLVGAYAGYFDVLGDYLYYVLGRSPAGTVKTAYRFDPNAGAVGQWVKLADLPAILVSAGHAATSDGMYLFGGIDTALNNTMSMFNGSTKTSMAMGTPAPTSRYDTAMSVVNGQLYVSGGNLSGSFTAELWRATV